MKFMFMSEGETLPGESYQTRYWELVDELIHAEKWGLRLVRCVGAAIHRYVPHGKKPRTGLSYLIVGVALGHHSRRRHKTRVPIVRRAVLNAVFLPQRMMPIVF